MLLLRRSSHDSQPSDHANANLDALTQFGVCGGFLASVNGPQLLVPGHQRTNYGNGYWGTGREQRAFSTWRESSADTASWSGFPTGAPHSRNFTFLVRFRLNSATSATGVVARTWTIWAVPSGNTIPIWRSTSGNWGMRIANTNYTAAGTFSTGVWYDLDIVGTDSACTLSVDGSVVIAGSAAAAAALQRTIGFGDSADSTNADDGYIDIEYALFCNRALSAGDLAMLRSNPWQLYERTIMVPVMVSAGTTYTLSAPTYVPGSITSTGLTARVMVTAA